MTSAQMLARFKLLANRPSTDEAWSDANIYLLLEQAQREINIELAMHVPHANISAPTLLTSGDSGLTYTTASDVIGGLEVYPTNSSTVPLVPGSYDSDGADYVFESPRTIRMIGRQARTFSSGPYARFVADTSTLGASNEPTVKPTAAHIAVVYRALQEYARVGGYRDPAYWYDAEQRVLWGDPASAGSAGIIPALKAQVRPQGRARGGLWWDIYRS